MRMITSACNQICWPFGERSLKISPMAYELSNKLTEHKIERYKKHTTERKLISVGIQIAVSLKMSKNQMRRKQIFCMPAYKDT